MVVKAVEDVEAEVRSLAASETLMVPLSVAVSRKTLMVLLVVGSCTKKKEKLLMFAPAGRILTSGKALTIWKFLAQLTSTYTSQQESLTVSQQLLFTLRTGLRFCNAANLLT